MGELPNKVIRQSKLFESEPRLGIVRDRKKGITKEGLLYQSLHLRPINNIKVGAIVKGISDNFHPCVKQLTRFGGEGRLAGVEIKKAEKVLLPELPNNKGQNLLLMLSTEAHINPDFECLTI